MVDLLYAHVIYISDEKQRWGGDIFALSELIKKALHISASKLAQCKEQSQAAFPIVSDR